MARVPDDIIVRDEGTVWQFTTLTDRVRTWVDENVQLAPWQRLSPHAFGVDHRCAQGLLEGLLDAGFVVSVIERLVR